MTSRCALDTIAFRSAVLSCVWLAAAGCATEVTDGTEESKPVPNAASVANLVLEIDLGGSHRIEVWEYTPGHITIHELGVIGKHSPVLDNSRVTMVELYTRFVEDRDPVLLDQLRELDDRIVRYEAAEEEYLKTVPPPPAVKTEDGLVDKSWFTENFCGTDDWGGGWNAVSGAFDRLFSSLPSSWPWQADRSRSTVFVHNDPTTCGVYQTEYRWNGSAWIYEWSWGPIETNHWQSVVENRNGYVKWEAESWFCSGTQPLHDHCILEDKL